MKTNFIVALATSILLYSCSAKLNKSNNSINELSIDKGGKPMLLGECNRTTLIKAPFGEWFEKNYSAYYTNDSMISKIKPLMSKKTIVIYLGTWCGDSKREVPRMLRVLDNCDLKKSQVKLVMLDNHDSTYKQSPGHEEKGLNIHRVPTFIVYENSKELGRIVESPVISLEKDLLAILNGDNYRPNYKAVVYMDSLFKKDKITAIDNKLLEISETIKPILKNAAELNSYGYVLMAARSLDKALLIFKLNILLFPNNSNLYDSLGEYYFNTGNNKMAREHYERVLELDPKNENAKKLLEKMKE